MEIKVDRKDLIEALKIVKKAVAKRYSIPALECILLNAEDNKLTLTATDLELSITTEIKASIESSGKCLIPASSFAYVVQAVDEQEIEIMSNNKEACIKSLNDLIVIKGIDVDEYATVPIFNGEYTLNMSQQAFKSLIKETTFAVATNDIGRPALQGVRFIVKGSKLTMVALNGFRMVISTFEVESTQDLDCIISGKLLDKICSTIKKQDGAIQFGIQNKHMFIKYDSTVAVAKLFEDINQIDYEQVIPKEFKISVSVETDKLLQACKKAKYFAEKGNNTINFSITDHVCISAESDIGQIHTTIETAKTGEDITIAFNANYLSDGLKQFGGKKINIDMVNNISPCLITGDESDYRYLILPVRFKKQ